MGNKVDLTGQRFGRLFVVEETEERTLSNEIKWKCICDCGNTTIVSSPNLRHGHTQSCGCLQKERASESHKKYNQYNLSGKYGIGWTTNTNKEFYFDLEDYDKIKNASWYENDQGYVIGEQGNQVIRQHRLVMGMIAKEDIIDHINRNKADNRKINLRIANKQTNGINRGANCNNKIGYKGINKVFNSDKFCARIMINGKTIHLGVFDNINDAIEARKNKEKEIFGEFYDENNWQ